MPLASEFMSCSRLCGNIYSIAELASFPKSSTANRHMLQAAASRKPGVSLKSFAQSAPYRHRQPSVQEFALPPEPVLVATLGEPHHLLAHGNCRLLPVLLGAHAFSEPN